MGPTEWWIVTLVASILILLFVGLEILFPMPDQDGDVRTDPVQDRSTSAGTKVVS